MMYARVCMMISIYIQFKLGLPTDCICFYDFESVLLMTALRSMLLMSCMRSINHVTTLPSFMSIYLRLSFVSDEVLKNDVLTILQLNFQPFFFVPNRSPVTELTNLALMMRILINANN